MYSTYLSFMLPSIPFWSPISNAFKCIVPVWCKATYYVPQVLHTIPEHISWQACTTRPRTVSARGEALLQGKLRRVQRVTGAYLDPQRTCLHACAQAHPPQMLQVGLLGPVGLTAQQVDSTSKPEPRCFCAFRWCCDGRCTVYSTVEGYHSASLSCSTCQRSSPMPREPEPASTTNTVLCLPWSTS